MNAPRSRRAMLGDVARLDAALSLPRPLAALAGMDEPSALAFATSIPEYVAAIRRSTGIIVAGPS